MFQVYRIMPEEEALEIYKKLQTLEWQQGKARTVEATGTLKRNQEMFASSSPEAEELAVKVQKAFLENRDIKQTHFVKRVLPPMFNKYEGNESRYGRHVDAAVLWGSFRSDLSCTVFLTPMDAYEGGVLHIETIGGTHTVKGPPGTCVIYNTSAPHWVSDVTKGERISGIVWIESLFRNPHQRDILRRFNDGLSKDDKVLLGSAYQDLVRMWVEYT